MSIFTEENKVGSQWFSMKEIGDSLEGTVISISKQINRLNGLEQTVYEILTEEGQVWKYGTKPAIERMLNRIRPVRLGQIVGFKFTEKRASTDVGKSPTHIIEVYANPNIVNEKWLGEYNSALAAQSNSTVETTQEESFDAGENLNVEAEDDVISSKLVKESEIMELAKAKLVGVTASNLKTKVMTATRLAFAEVNYDKILTALKAIE